jgi:hypothetical protein
MDESKKGGLILLAAAVIVAPRLRDLKDSAALRSEVADAIRVAEYMARLIEQKYRNKEQSSGNKRSA